MSNDDKKDQVAEDGAATEAEARRRFLKKAGRLAAKGAVIAPAAAMVLAASSRRAWAPEPLPS